MRRSDPCWRLPYRTKRLLSLDANLWIPSIQQLNFETAIKIILMYGYQCARAAVFAVRSYIPPMSSLRQMLEGSAALGTIRREGPPIFGMPSAWPVHTLCLIPRGRHRDSRQTHDRQITFRNRGGTLTTGPGGPLKFLPWPDDCAHQTVSGNIVLEPMAAVALLSVLTPFGFLWVELVDDMT
jgi:hypothetical protein